MSVRLARLFAVALIGVCLTSTAVAHSAHKAGNANSLIWRGDVATANGVVDEVARAWEKAGHGRIVLQPFNTASGIDAVSTGRADLAGSARPSDGSAEDSRLTFTPVAWDGLVIVTSASNPVHNLTLKQVHDIYYGLIHNWSEVGGNNAPINVYAVASPGDGVEYSLRTLLFGRGDQPVAAPRLYLNTTKLEEGIALNPNGMGAATLSSIAGNPKLKAVAIDGKAATVANIADGSYPLYIPLYLVTNPHGPKKAQVQAFLNFMQSAPAKAALRKHAVLPYQDDLELASMDSARRKAIYAEVGVPASNIAAIAAPGATYAAGVAIAPTSANTLAARTELEKRQAREKNDARLQKVSGSAPTTGLSAKTYTVSKGDTLTLIARQHSVEVSQLRQWNHLHSDKLRLGQVLVVSEN